ncbi:hypothetical protein HN51_044703 [Arachis hypogaea]|uniref:FMR1-interacting protein 1 conserved domain-containing protein n=1 Tax=Arachis hypogaea TaxID=3818 RepID=A0A444Y0D1_ARAHY|nr:uncharacterized protein LOC107612498 isoform X1 [Arachis ipaensis]XP_025673249.1 uncharacterized protein LOC112772500 isoform X1 [Arachis hypogaea]RYQ95380.1 hypothetical protein Ahy_B08g090655 isoform B [Arachis hypogaea]
MSAPNHQIPLQNNGMGMQNQPQMGAANQLNQNLMPPYVSNMQPSMNTHQFMNAANHLLPLQNNQLHMSNMGMSVPPQGPSHAGFGPQNGVSNAGYNPMFQAQGQVMHNAAQINLSQFQGHILAQSILSMLQQPNMNMNIPNGQFSSQFPVQNMNQQLPMQVPNPSQVGLHGVHPGSGPMFGFPGQVPQAMVSQNPMFSSMLHTGLVQGNQVRPQFDQNEKSLVLPNGNTNAFVSSSFSSMQLQGNSSASHAQTNANSNTKSNDRNSSWKGSQSKNFKNKQTRGGFQGRFQKCKFPKEHRDKGPNNGRIEHQQKPKFSLNPKEQQQEPKRPFFVTYTDQEIRQWREARRKNHPFNNIQKKQSEHTRSPKVDRVVLQRELKQVLAKQAELGVEVAEIPSYYLKDRENQGPQSEGKDTLNNKKRKFQNKFNRKPDRKDRFSKKQKFTDKDSLEQRPSITKKKPTLLQKLLSADIKKDKSHLIQAFRFMVTNSFFKYYPDKPLIYPSVVVKETGSEGNAGEKHLHAGKDVLDHDNKKTVKKIVNDDINDVHFIEEEESDDDDYENLQKEPSSLVQRQRDNGIGIEKCDEEEGEIID